MTTPFHLTTKAVAQAALKGFREKTLPAQHGETCLYRTDSGNMCAVGQALPVRLIKTILKRGLNARVVSVLEAHKLVTYEPEVAGIQKAHDRWAQSVQVKSPNKTRLKQKFLKLVTKLAES